MPEIYENALKSALSRGEISPVYILHGDDSYLVNRYEKIIISKTCGLDNEFDLQKFERDVNLRDVYDAVNQFSMLGGRKCVVLSDYDFESASNDDFEKLLSLLSDNYELSTLIVKFDAVEFDVKHSARAAKIISFAEKGGGCAVILNHRSETEIIKILTNAAKKNGKQLENSVARYMLENCGSDINTLSRELNKVCNYSINNTITKEDIDLVCTKTVDANVYGLAAQIINCNTLGALNMLGDLIYMRVEPTIILHAVASAFIDMSRVSAAIKSKKTVADVKTDFSYGGRSFIVDKAANNLRKFSDKTLILCMDELLNADRIIKSYMCDAKLALEEMTVNLIYIIANGETLDKN